MDGLAVVVAIIRPGGNLLFEEFDIGDAFLPSCAENLHADRQALVAQDAQFDLGDIEGNSYKEELRACSPSEIFKSP